MGVGGRIFYGYSANGCISSIFKRIDELECVAFHAAVAEAKAPKSHYQKLSSEQQQSIFPLKFLDFPSEIRNKVYTILLTDLCKQPMRFLAMNKWPMGCAKVQIGEHIVTQTVLPDRPAVTGGLLMTCKAVNKEYMSMLSRNANITIIIPDLVLDRDADLATAFAPLSRQVNPSFDQLYTAPKFLRLSSFRPEFITQFTLHLLLPTSIPDEPTELFTYIRLIDGGFLAQMTALQSLTAILTYNASNPDKHSITEWLECQAVRLAVATVVENTKAKIYWVYDVVSPRAREYAREVRTLMRRFKNEGSAGREKRKLMGRICNLWMLLGHGTFFHVQSCVLASKQLHALAMEMEQKAIGGYKKGGKYGK